MVQNFSNWFNFYFLWSCIHDHNVEKWQIKLKPVKKTLNHNMNISEHSLLISYFSATSSLSFTNLLVSMFVLVLSWIVGIIFPVALSIILTHARRSLSWFCRPYLLIPLYAIPSLLGIGFVHFITRRLLESKVC